MDTWLIALLVVASVVIVLALGWYFFRYYFSREWAVQTGRMTRHYD